MEKIKQDKVVKEKLRNPSNNTGQERVGENREEELFSDCDKNPVTLSVWGRQGERNFS